MGLSMRADDKCWIASWVDAKGRRRQKRLGKDRAQAKLRAAALEAESEFTWQDNTACSIRGPAWEAAIAQYESFQRVQGCCSKHIKQCIAKVNELAGWFPEGPDAVSVAKLNDHLINLGPSQINRRFQAWRAFFRWYVDVCDDSRLSGPPTFKNVPDKGRTKRRRRVMSRIEQINLLESMPTITYGGLLHWQRRMLYWTALETGFRFGELMKMRAEQFTHGTTIPLYADQTKNGKEVHQPIRTVFALEVAKWGSCYNKRMKMWATWDGTTTGADMLRLDLAAAGIEYKTDEGVLDFHALRHTYVSRVAKKTRSVHALKQLARHSSIKTTEKYLHSDGSEERRVVEEL